MAAERTITRRVPGFEDLPERIARAIRLSAQLSALSPDDADAIRAAWSELTGQAVDDTFSLIPPVQCQYGLDLRVGRRVFINQGCTLMDLGGLAIGDDVMVGPNVSLITMGHPLAPSQRRAGITMSPIVIERNVWIGAGATVLAGVTVGADSVVGAGAVVTRDVPPATLVAGVPAQVVRSIAEG